MAQLLQSEKKIHTYLQTKLAATKELNKMEEWSNRNQVSLNEDLELQLRVAQAELKSI